MEAGTRRHRSNKLWFTLHGWVGVQLGVLLFVVMFSGTLATVAHELDWLLNPALRVTPQERTVSYGRILEAVRQAYPQRRVSFIQAPLGPRFAAEVWAEQPGAEDFTATIRRVYVNPYTGEVQGDTGWFNLQRTLRNFHMMLSLPALGIYVVSLFGFALLLSVVTALLFYKRWWRRFLVLRADRGRRVLWSDLHRLGGLWSLWFTLLIAVTGIWYFIEMGLFDAGVGLQDIPDPYPAAVVASAPPHDEPPGLDALLARARQAYPGLRIAGIRLPESPDQAVDVSGHGAAWLVRSRANRVFLDPRDGAVLAVYRGEELPLAYRWVHTADPLHFGDFGGLASKLVWFGFGLIGSGLSLTGTWLWYRRQCSRQPAGSRRSAAAATVRARA